jgi:hypothetical protein
MWRLWAKAIGPKATDCNHESDKIAVIRTFIFLSYFITNLVIIYGVLRTHHYPNNHVSISSCSTVR